MTTSLELYKEELDNFRELMIELTTDLYKTHGEIHPAMFALSIKEEKFEIAALAGLGMLLASKPTKEFAREVMKNFAEHRKPIAIAFMCEGTAAKIKTEDFDPDNIPDDLEMRDILMLTLETYDMQSAITWEVDSSNPDRPTILVDLDQDWEEKTDSKGLFNDILQEDYSDLAQEIRKLMDN